MVHEIPATPLASASVIAVHLVVTLLGANTYQGGDVNYHQRFQMEPAVITYL